MEPIVVKHPPPCRKPPAPVPLVTVRCWACRRIVVETTPGAWVRHRCKCNEWVNEAAPLEQAAA